MNKEYEVVVVGGRCAGSTTARLLSEGGMRVALVERATLPSDTVSTHAIAGHGTLLLQRWGLFEGLRALGTPNPHAVSLRMGDAAIDAFPLDPHVGFFAPRRTIIDAVLLDVARDAGVDIMTGVAVEDVLLDDGVVRGVRVRDGDDTHEIRSQLVVGADGAESRVARAVGAPRYRVHESAVCGVYAYFTGTGVDHPRLAFAHGQCALAFPTNDGQLCVAAALPVRRRREVVGAGEEAFVRAIEAVSPELGAALRASERAGRFVTFAPRDAHFTVPYGPGWALVGDAGHYKDPITGQGIADALLTAQLLGDSVLRGDDLAGYQQTRDELLGDIHDITADLARMRWTDDEVLALFMRYREAVDATAHRVRSGNLRPSVDVAVAPAAGDASMHGLAPQVTR